ncbi:MAG: class I SAM-dependent rRNA methyltransferase [Lentisphaeria bacterium]|nr:class I SAM-dependent rRNA methyltransferase [Lentisphaeria bacterium]
MAEIRLKRGRDRSLLRRHPWIFSGAVQSVSGDPDSGETVDVLSADGTFLARAAWSPGCGLCARVWTFCETESVDDAFFAGRFDRAALLRRRIFPGGLPDAYRLIHSEADGLPGFTCDIYGGFVVCQFTSAGAERYRAVLTREAGRFAPRGVYERSDCDARSREGLPFRTGLILGEEPPENLTFTENGIRYFCDVRRGHKTGFYLDQRENRLAVRNMAAGAEEVLNCFCYTGGFGLAVLAGGAKHVCNVDASAEVLALARKNAELNGFGPDRFECLEADVFSYLRQCRDCGKTFDLIVLDPPKFADSAAALPRAARGYKDINLLAMKLLKPGGILFTFSCSGAMNETLFSQVVDSAASDAKLDFRIVRTLSQGPDHPVSSAVPESRYLKGLGGIRF